MYPQKRQRYGLLLRCTLAGVAALLASGCQSLGFGLLNSGRSSTPAVESVIYEPVHDLALDIHRPPTWAAGQPIAIFFYGGSWRSGSRCDYAFVGEALARSGIVTVIPDYRQYPQGHFPDFEFDAAHAVRWVRDHAAEIGGDPQRIFLVGHSAGAHIAALLATDQSYLASVAIKPRELAGVIGVSGPYDFLPLTDPALGEVFGAEEDWPAAQPGNFALWADGMGNNLGSAWAESGWRIRQSGRPKSPSRRATIMECWIIRCGCCRAASSFLCVSCGTARAAR